MNIKDLIIKLINATGLSREEIYEMVEMKKRELKHSISNFFVITIFSNKTS